MKTLFFLLVVSMPLSLAAHARVPGVLVQVVPTPVQTASTQTASGGIKGKVRLPNGGAAPGVVVAVVSGETELTHTSTNRKGEFLISGLAPGEYTISFQKEGLSRGVLRRHVTVLPGRVADLGEKLVLSVDEGSFAFVRGSVFDASGRAVEGARVELMKVYADGKLKKYKDTVSGEAGEFVFRLQADAVKYRVMVKWGDADPVTKDIEVDGPVIHRIALSLAVKVPR